MRNIAANASVDTDVLPIPLRLKGILGKCGGNYYSCQNDYYDSYMGDYDYEDLYFGGNLPEVDVTPNNDSENWDWWDSEYPTLGGLGIHDPNDPLNNDWGNGGNSNIHNESDTLTDDQLIARGAIVANAICDSISNGTAIQVQKITDTNAYKAAVCTNFGANFAISEMDVYSTIMNSPTVLKSFGGMLGGANAIGGGLIAYFALTDGEITTSDLWGAAGAALGVVGYAVGFFSPPVALVIGGAYHCLWFY